jgi:putative tryptophan/tyrosine transport system substrate-binding protein
MRFSHLRRRDFVTLLGGAAAAWPLTAHAQQLAVPVIGFIEGDFGPRSKPLILAAFRKGLGETGYVEGQNVAIESRSAEGQNDRLPALAAELVRRRVAVIVTLGSTAAALAANAATQTIPIVFRIGGDPVARGLVASLNRPGGNVTGTTTLGVELGPKRLELLRELLPAAAAVALLVNPTNANAAAETREIQAAADRLGVRLLILNTSSPSDIETAFARITQQGIDGVLTTAEPLFFQQSERLIALAARHAVPAIYSSRRFFEAGGLISYGNVGLDEFRQAGVYTGRILKGEKPADLPVQQSTKVELMINLKTAKALGLTVPPSLLARADEVIE